MLVASTSPFVVLYRKGYVRLCIGDYQTDTDVMAAHLTNQVRRSQTLPPSHRRVRLLRFMRSFFVDSFTFIAFVNFQRRVK